MSNVVALTLPARRATGPARLSALINSFAGHRRFGDDVFWLKENAELLNILESTNAGLEPEALDPFDGFYERIEKRLSFFPQYYRFLLSICLDLEDLGMPGQKGEALVHWAGQQGLAQAELSDLQRAEARRILIRRGVDPMAGDPGLNDRLRAFIGRPATFALPNKKAAYELTHIVFYLSAYGRRDPHLDEAALTSLEFAGLLAFLDQNADLLAEVCVALRFAGQRPSPIWEGWLARETQRFGVETGPQARPDDDYHDYFVCNWLMALSGRPAFVQAGDTGPVAFRRLSPVAGPLRHMSEALFRSEHARSADWHVMRPVLEESLTEIDHDILSDAQNSSDKFDAFFAGFARAGAPV